MIIIECDDVFREAYHEGGGAVEKVTRVSKAAMQGASLTPSLIQIKVCWYWREVWSCSGVDALGEGLEMCPELIMSRWGRKEMS